MTGIAAATATMLLGTSSPASASSWGCTVNAYPAAATASCAGNGPMRVAAYCDSDHWPYRTTIYGAWASNNSEVDRLSNCFISSAWVEVA
ncbi:hypothetical protein [Streptomyces sp. NPDC004788]